MDIFVTGATGVLGRPVVRGLVAGGHHVRALSRSAQNATLLGVLGAAPISADLFEAASLKAAITGCDAILHLATKIPPSAQAGRPGAWLENDRIRAEGTRNLVDAALATDVNTFVYPSFGFVYPDSGAAWIDAMTAPAVPNAILRSTLAAETEVARFAAAGRRGISLRMAAFYGPEAPTTQDQLRLAQRGIAPLMGSRTAYFPTIWVDDAAQAVVAALAHAPAGLYDVVDDEPLRRDEILAAIAQCVGRRRLMLLPTWLLRLLGGTGVVTLSRGLRVSNRRFKEATGWTPAVPDARVGWARLAMTLPAHDHAAPESQELRHVS